MALIDMSLASMLFSMVLLGFDSFSDEPHEPLWPFVAFLSMGIFCVATAIWCCEISALWLAVILFIVSALSVPLVRKAFAKLHDDHEQRKTEAKHPARLSKQFNEDSPGWPEYRDSLGREK